MVGSPYDVGDDIGQIVGRVAPRAGEPTIVKTYPNAFIGTDLDERLTAGPGRDLILAGFNDPHVRELHRPGSVQPRLPTGRGGRCHRDPGAARPDRRVGALS